MRRRSRMAGVLAAIGLATGMTLAGAGAARADVIPPFEQWAEIYSPYLTAQGLTLCFDDPASSTSSGTRVQLYHCHGYASNGAPQRWVFIQQTDDNGTPINDEGHRVYEIYNMAAGECLGAPNIAVGTQLTLGSCTRAVKGGPILWELLGTGPDFELFPWPIGFPKGAFPNGVCAVASNASGSNGTRLVWEPCDPSNTARVFRLG